MRRTTSKRRDRKLKELTYLRALNNLYIASVGGGMSFGALPPEVNSSRMAGGGGSAKIAAARAVR